MDRMTPQEMVEHLKAMGLCTIDRAKVMETYRDAGQDEALEQAERHVAIGNAAVARAKAGAATLCGVVLP